MNFKDKKSSKSNRSLMDILKKSKEKRKSNLNTNEKSSRKKLNLSKNMTGFFKNFLSKQIDENIKKYIFCKQFLF